MGVRCLGVLILQWYEPSGYSDWQYNKRGGAERNFEYLKKRIDIRKKTKIRKSIFFYLKETFAEHVLLEKKHRSKRL